ncbi:unnamed protein product [Calypogeia fissa]
MDNLQSRIALVTVGRRGWRDSYRNRWIGAASWKSTDAADIEGSAVVRQVLGAVACFEDFKRTWTGGTREVVVRSANSDLHRQFGETQSVLRGRHELL